MIYVELLSTLWLVVHAASAPLADRDHFSAAVSPDGQVLIRWPKTSHNSVHAGQAELEFVSDGGAAVDHQYASRDDENASAEHVSIAGLANREAPIVRGTTSRKRVTAGNASLEVSPERGVPIERQYTSSDEEHVSTKLHKMANPAQPVALNELLRRRSQTEFQVLCEVRHPTDAKAHVVKVLMAGEHRFLTFGADPAEEWESLVRCRHVDCMSSSTVVDNVTKCPPCPCDLTGARVVDDQYYDGPLINAVKPFCSHGEDSPTVDILMIGLGGGVFHRHLRQSCPKSTRIRTIELDPRVPRIAEQYFGLELERGISEVQVGDALEILKSMSQKSHHVLSEMHSAYGLGDFGWDVLVVDCFNDDEIPQNCKSVEFLDAARGVLKPGGAVIQHAYHDWIFPNQSFSITQRNEFRKLTQNYNDVFGSLKVNILPLPPNVSNEESLIVAHK